MSETKEATYKSLLQRMVHMTEQRDFDEDLMDEVYEALPTELPPPSEAPSETSVEEERWARWIEGGGRRWLAVDHSDTKRRAEHFPVIVRSKAADDELRERARKPQTTQRLDAASRFRNLNAKLATLTAERDDLSRKLAVAEGELKRAERIASMDSNLLVDERIRCIAELESQLAEAINSQVDATEQLEREREDYETLVKEAVELRKQIATPHACAAHAPVARYPEVVEFLDAAKRSWSISANLCEGKAGYVVEASNIKGGTWFARDTLAAACRAALDSRKELSDVD